MNKEHVETIHGLDLLIALVVAWVVAVGGGFVGVSIWDAYSNLERSAVVESTPTPSPVHYSKAALRKIIVRGSVPCDVPWRLSLAVAETESSLRPHVVSAHGAVGLMQIKPSTAKEISPSLDIVHSPLDNVVAGTCYLKRQLRGPATREGWRDARGFCDFGSVVRESRLKYQPRPRKQRGNPKRR